MPEAVIEAELWEVFGGRSEYLASPLIKVQEQRCRIIARHKVEAKQQAEQEAELEEQRHEMERNRH